MKALEHETQAAGKYSIAAYLDARMRNSVGISNYSDAEVARANRMKYVLELCYRAKSIYINYRQRYISVKVDAGKVVDRTMLTELEAGWKNECIAKIVTAQGIIYRIPART